MGTTNKDVHIKAIFAVMNLSGTESEAWKKIQVCMGFKPVTTSAIPVQSSTNWANLSQLWAGYYVGSK